VDALIVGADVDGFCRILERAGHKVTTRAIPVATPRLESLDGDSQDEALRLYGSLGGRLQSPTLTPGPWDILVDGVLVELDEELHFNRYRSLTLESPSYSRLRGFPVVAYRSLCDEHEVDCLKAGRGQKRWMNDSTERHFGPSGPRGDLSGGGSSRWKQRALYDFMKDFSVLSVGGPKLARISIWETLPDPAGLTVGAVVNDADAGQHADALWELVTRRACR
jgi:hypothetical protein